MFPFIIFLCDKKCVHVFVLEMILPSERWFQFTKCCTIRICVLRKLHLIGYVVYCMVGNHRLVCPTRRAAAPSPATTQREDGPSGFTAGLERMNSVRECVCSASQAIMGPVADPGIEISWCEHLMSKFFSLQMQLYSTKTNSIQQ